MLGPVSRSWNPVLFFWKTTDTTITSVRLDINRDSFWSVVLTGRKSSMLIPHGLSPDRGTKSSTRLVSTGCGVDVIYVGGRGLCRTGMFLGVFSRFTLGRCSSDRTVSAGPLECKLREFFLTLDATGGLCIVESDGLCRILLALEP